MTEWKIQGSRVYSNGEGKSYNCHNQITAKELHHTLTTYEQVKQQVHETSQKYDKITKQLIQIQMSLRILDQEIQTLKELVTE